VGLKAKFIACREWKASSLLALSKYFNHRKLRYIHLRFKYYCKREEKGELCPNSARYSRNCKRAEIQKQQTAGKLQPGKKSRRR
jgi:hypothetical protein